MLWCVIPTLGSDVYKMLVLFVLSSVVVSLSLGLVFVNSLVIFGIVCLLLVFFLCNLAGFLISSWVGLITFLVYIGGLIVIFGYFLAICPNQLIEFQGFRYWVAVAGLVIRLLCNYGKPVFTGWLDAGLSVEIFFRGGGVVVLAIVGCVLFVTLVAVVKVVERRRGPLRPFRSKGRHGVRMRV